MTSLKREPRCSGWVEVGIDYDDVVQTLEDQGVEKFAESWRELVDDVDQARSAHRH